MRWLVALVLMAAMACPVFADEDPRDGIASEHDEIMDKLGSLILKKVELKDASQAEAAHILTEESKKVDPQHKGIRIIYAGQPGERVWKITLSFDNVSLREALKKLFSYSVGDSAVHAWHEDGDGLSSGTFSLPEGFIKLLPGQSSLPWCDVAPQLEAMGMHFAPGTRAVYEPTQRKLDVIQEQGEIEDLEYLIYKAMKAKRPTPKATE